VAFRARHCAHSLCGQAGAIYRRNALPFRAALPFRLARTAEYPHGTVPCTACCTLRGAAEAAVPHRLITRRTYKAEMFHRAAAKLGLDQAVFGGSQVDRTRHATIAHATHATCNI
jgi:hypothetical protein